MATIAISGVVGFTAIVCWLHLARRDVDPGTRGISHYAVGSTHGVMTLAFVSLAIACAASSVRNPLFAVAALGLFVVAAVPVPGEGEAAWRGPAHTLAALAFILSAPVAALASGINVSLAVGWAAANVLFLVSMAGAPFLFSVRGWLQRICFGFSVVWLIAAALYS